MNSTRHALIYLLALGAAAAQLSGAGAASSAKRQEILDLATRLLAPQPNPAGQLPADLINPFNPEARADLNGSDAKSGRRSDREILEKLAADITPSGMMVLGGRPRLIFREKKYTVGETIKRTIEGADYVVEITAIEATSFRLRLNHEEITRPIKPQQ
jgi:hypothetical protein